MEDYPEGKLMTAIFGEDGPGYYPYILVEEADHVRMIKLMEAVREALATLPSRDQRELDLRYGLTDGIPKTLKEVGKELALITGEAARRIEKKAVRKLRHPSRSRSLKRFFIPTPEKMYHLEQEISSLRAELKEFWDKASTPVKTLQEPKVEKPVPTAKELEDDQAALRDLSCQFPNNRVWNALRRLGINDLSTLRDLVEHREIRKQKGIGIKAEKFLQGIL